MSESANTTETESPEGGREACIDQRTDRPGDPAATSELCGCASWRKLVGSKFLASHHPDCLHYDLEGDCHKVITDLLRGIEASFQDTVGIHPALWEAYKRARASVLEFDWKEDTEGQTTE